MITLPAGTRVRLAGGFTDMRKGFDGLAMLVQEKLRRDPFGGQPDLIKAHGFLFVLGARAGLRRKPCEIFIALFENVPVLHGRSLGNKRGRSGGARN